MSTNANYEPRQEEEGDNETYRKIQADTWAYQVAQNQEEPIANRNY